MSHPNVKVVEHRFGRGVVATGPIAKDEVIASFDGEVFYGVLASEYPEDVIDYPISFGDDRARHSAGIAHLINHSCIPNCGIHRLFDVVAMRDISEGEELCWDYDMSEDSDWFFECECGTDDCRGTIKGFRFMPEKQRVKYAGYISEWLLEKYGLVPATSSAVSDAQS